MVISHQLVLRIRISAGHGMTGHREIEKLCEADQAMIKAERTANSVAKFGFVGVSWTGQFTNCRFAELAGKNQN